MVYTRQWLKSDQAWTQGYHKEARQFVLSVLDFQGQHFPASNASIVYAKNQKLIDHDANTKLAKVEKFPI